jgi:Glycosyltransferase family 87
MLGVRTWVCSALCAAALLVATVALVGRSLTDPLVPRATKYLTTSYDLRRYRAYCNAALGRPYPAFYVRTEEAWRRAFLAGEHLPDEPSPVVTPARPLRPYRDYLVEYPPGFFLAALPPAILTRTETGYGITFELLMAALFVAATMCCGRLAPYLGTNARTLSVLRWSVLAAVALGIISVQRYDAAVALLVCVICLATVRRQPIMLGVAAGAVIAVKIVPGVVALLSEMYLVRQRRLGDLATAAAAAVVTVAVIALPVAYAAGSTMDRVMWYHFDRPLEIESTAAGLLGLWHAIDPSAVSFIFSFGSNNVAGPLVAAGAWASNVATALALALVYVLAWRDLQRAASAVVQARVLAGATLLALVVLIAFGKVSSPQYFTWVVPLGALMTLVDGRGGTMAWFLGSMVLAQIVFPTEMHAVIQFAPWACALVVGRNAAILGWALRLRQRAWRL